MDLSQWQIDQGASCSCKGMDEYCPCQNVDESDPKVWARRIGDMATRMLEMAPKAGLYIGITIKPAEAQGGSAV